MVIENDNQQFNVCLLSVVARVVRFPGQVCCRLFGAYSFQPFSPYLLEIRLVIENDKSTVYNGLHADTDLIISSCSYAELFDYV